MDFFSSTDSNLYTLVVIINSIIFNFTLSGRDFQKCSVPEINIKSEFNCRYIRLNQY